MKITFNYVFLLCLLGSILLDRSFAVNPETVSNEDHIKEKQIFYPHKLVFPWRDHQGAIEEQWPFLKQEGSSVPELPEQLSIIAKILQENNVKISKEYVYIPGKPDSYQSPGSNQFSPAFFHLQVYESEPVDLRVAKRVLGRVVEKAKEESREKNANMTQGYDELAYFLEIEKESVPNHVSFSTSRERKGEGASGKIRYWQGRLIIWIGFGYGGYTLSNLFEESLTSLGQSR